MSQDNQRFTLKDLTRDRLQTITLMAEAHGHNSAVQINTAEETKAPAPKKKTSDILASDSPCPGRLMELRGSGKRVTIMLCVGKTKRGEEKWKVVDGNGVPWIAKTSQLGVIGSRI